MGDFIPVQRRKPKKGSRQSHHQKIMEQHRLREIAENKSPEELVEQYENIVRRYKTVKCKEGWGRPYPFCSAGKQCFYAHSETELRRDPLKARGVQRYSRGVCQSKDNCANGQDCPYSHNDSETMYHPRTYKTKPCKHGKKCERGVYCAFHHEEDVLTSEIRNQLFLQRDSKSNRQHSRSYDLASPSSDSGRSRSKSAADIGVFDEENENHHNAHNIPILSRKQSKKKKKHLQMQHDIEERRPHEEDGDFVEEEDQKEDECQPQESPRGVLSRSDMKSMEETSRRHSLSIGGLSPLGQPSASPLGSPFGSPLMSPLNLPSLNTKRLQSASTVLGMLNPSFNLSSVQAEALLDMLYATDEGKIAQDDSQNSGLLHAVSRGLRKFVPMFANANTIDTPNLHNQTPLSIAINGDDVGILEDLIKCGVNLNSGEGALLQAIKSGSSRCAFLLASHPAVNFLATDMDGATALAIAAERGYDQLVNVLAIHRSLLEMETNNGEAPLLLACRNGNGGCAVSLLQHGANVHTRDKHNMSPLAYAQQRGYNDIAQMLYENGAMDDNQSFFSHPSTPLMTPSSGGRLSPLSSGAMSPQSHMSFPQTPTNMTQPQLPTFNSVPQEMMGGQPGPYDLYGL